MFVNILKVYNKLDVNRGLLYVKSDNITISDISHYTTGTEYPTAFEVTITKKHKNALTLTLFDVYDAEKIVN